MSTIRIAAAGDIGRVVALWEACALTRPWNDPMADYRRALDHPAATIFVAEADDTLTGTAMTGFDGHRGWIYYLGVAPASRGSGIGRALLDACCDWLRAQGCPKAELMVRDDNPAAAFYERLGWDRQQVRTYARWLD